MNRKNVCAVLLAMLLLATAGPARAEDARADLIDRMIATAERLYKDAEGEAQRAHYREDLYVCKNFVSYVFSHHSGAFRMQAYPEVILRMPGNLPAEDCLPYVYGIAWQAVAAEDGNPFEVAASFRYDDTLSDVDNIRNALAFTKKVKKGDFLQMAADYEYGAGPHSLLFIDDYNTETFTLRWTDSNMRGGNSNGIRYGIVQYGEERRVDWFVEAICYSRYGATLYRLREDIVYAP